MAIISDGQNRDAELRIQPGGGNGRVTLYNQEGPIVFNASFGRRITPFLIRCTGTPTDVDHSWLLRAGARDVLIRRLAFAVQTDGFGATATPLFVGLARFQCANPIVALSQAGTSEMPIITKQGFSSLPSDIKEIKYLPGGGNLTNVAGTPSVVYENVMGFIGSTPFTTRGGTPMPSHTLALGPSFDGMPLLTLHDGEGAALQVTIPGGAVTLATGATYRGFIEWEEV